MAKIKMLKPRLAELGGKVQTLEGSPGSWRADKRKTAERGYGGRWQRARAQHLAANPLCVLCLAETPRRVTPATVVDHRDAHRGDPAIFWDRSRWQSLCASHHSSDAQRRDNGNPTPRRIGPDGWPIE